MMEFVIVFLPFKWLRPIYNFGTTQLNMMPYLSISQRGTGVQLNNTPSLCQFSWSRISSFRKLGYIEMSLLIDLFSSLLPYMSMVLNKVIFALTDRSIHPLLHNIWKEPCFCLLIQPCLMLGLLFITFWNIYVLDFKASTNSGIVSFSVSDPII